MEKKVLTVKEVAEYLGVHVDTVHRMVEADEIPHSCWWGEILFVKEMVDLWIDNLHLN
ncbi:helix-turn-helix domain-containing protein [Oceanobacillus luteolus]|uniref:Helix-turn-helix domain-containing protein n=1 Tax=Oceanobacillus luteolus TaxID=1274358 RepID=A0ABW4HX01_9BACI